jgi:hypothetical protein
MWSFMFEMGAVFGGFGWSWFWVMVERWDLIEVIGECC